MTTPAFPGTSPLTTESFTRTLAPPNVAALLNALVADAPFAGSLTRALTSTGRLAFPVAAPSGYAWLAELQQVPLLALNDQTMIVTVAKIAGALPVSSEMILDTTVNITAWASGALRDSLSRDLDMGLLHGSGEPQPDGIIDQADAVTGPTLTAAAGTAIAAIGEAGGQATTLAISPTGYVAEMTRTDSEGNLIHPAGLDSFLGLDIIQVPGLDPPLCYDASRCFLVLGNDPEVSLHDDWQHDGQILLVKARANVGVPVKAQAIRKLDIGSGSGEGTGQQPASASTRRGKAA